MKRILTSALRFIIPLSVGLVLLYFAFKNIDLKAFVQKTAITNYSWVIGSMLLSVLSYTARAYRWRILLAPAQYHVTTYRLTLAVFIGYLANLAFPRLGEVTRCAVIKKTDDVPITISIGTVVTERIFDALILLCCLGVAFLLEFQLIKTYFDQVFATYDINFSKIIYSLVGLSFFGLLLMIYLLKSNNKYSFKIRALVKTLITGMLTIKDIKNISGFIISTIVMWVIYFLMSYMIVFAMEETSFLSISGGFMLLVTGGIALALPVQGGIGTYHAMVSMMLVLYGVEQTTGIYLATLLHTSQVLAMVIFGGISIVLTSFLKKNSHESISK